jgi:hypothetical protein
MTIASRVPQIWESFRVRTATRTHMHTISAYRRAMLLCEQNKSTGQLSFITWFLNFGGSVARIFTTLQEVDDRLSTSPSTHHYIHRMRACRPSED